MEVPQVGGPGRPTCAVTECDEPRHPDKTHFSGLFCEAHRKAMEVTKTRNEPVKDMSRESLEASFAWGSLLMMSGLSFKGFDQRTARNLVALHNETVYEMVRRGYLK